MAGQPITQDKPLWVFQHIPKTAGTSLSSQIAASLPSVALYPESSLSDAEYAERRDRLVEEFTETTKPVQFAYGHLTAENMRLIGLRLPRRLPFTFLRNPLARLWSDYNYRCLGLQPEHTAFADQYPTFASYIEKPDNINVLCQFIGGEPGNADDCADILANEYAFVGCTERYADDFAALQTMIGFAGNSDIRLLTRPPIKPPTPNDIRLFERLNGDDLTLYGSLLCSKSQNDHEWR